jgi:hypothetical protein
MLAPVALLAVLWAGPAAAPAGASAQMPRHVPRAGPATRQAPLVSWAELVERRSLLLGKRVRVQLQFHAWVESWSPFLTRFGPGEYAAAGFWADEQMPWVETDYQAPAARLFVRRGGEAQRALREARVYRRYEALVEVREVFLDRPWVEIVALSPLEQSLSEGTVIHAGRACLLIANEAWRLAADELLRALAGDPPPLARRELEALRAVCLERR